MTVLALLAAFQVTKAQAPVVTINCPTGTINPGDYITIPVKMTGTTVGGWQLIIDYDRDILTYDSAGTGVAPTGLPPGTWGYNPSYSHTSFTGKRLKLLFLYTGGGSGATYSDQIIANLKFTFVGGSTTFSYTNKSTTTVMTGQQYTFVKANPYGTINLITTFSIGSVSGDYATITSVAGGGNWGTAASWDLAKVPNRSNKVVINSNPATPLINEATHICTGGLTINTGKAMTNNFPLTVNGNLLLKSVDLTGSGSYIDNSTTTVTGTTKVERYMTGNWNGSTLPPPSGTLFHYVSSPVSNCNAFDAFYGNLLFTFQEDSIVPSWVYIMDGRMPLAVGKGYNAATKSDGVITYYNGTLNKGDITITLTKNSFGPPAPTFTGYNLIGNPFPCSFDWSTFSPPSGMDAAAYVYDYNQYKVKIPGVPGTFDGIIPAEQGFFVKTTTNNLSLTLPANKRVHTAPEKYFKSSFSDLLTLKIAGNGNEDEALIYFDADATEGFDPQFDGYKLYGADAAPQLFSILPNDNLTINTLPSVNSNPVVAVGLKVGVTETYTITASGMESFANGSDIYLVDLFLNKTQNLNSNPVYEFTASPGSDMHRFDVHFAPTTGIPQGTSDNIKIYAAEKSVYVNIPMALQGVIIVYDLLGKEVKRQPIESNTLNKVNLNVQLGYYLVKVLGDKSTVSGKVFIR